MTSHTSSKLETFLLGTEPRRNDVGSYLKKEMRICYVRSFLRQCQPRANWRPPPVCRHRYAQICNTSFQFRFCGEYLIGATKRLREQEPCHPLQKQKQCETKSVPFHPEIGPESRHLHHRWMSGHHVGRQRPLTRSQPVARRVVIGLAGHTSSMKGTIMPRARRSSTEQY